MHSPPRFHSSCIQPLPGSCSSPQAREGASETGPRSARAPGRWASGLRWRRSRLDLSQSGRAAIASPNANGSVTTKADRGSDPAPRPYRLRPQRQPRLLIRIPLPPSLHQQQHRQTETQAARRGKALMGGGVDARCTMGRVGWE